MLRHRRHGPQRLRRRPQARDVGHLRHDRPPREAQPGRARGRRRPRDVPHQELRRPAPDLGRGHGRRRGPAQRLDAALVHVGRGRAPARPRARAARAAPRASLSSSAWPWPFSRPFIATIIQLAVSRKREFLADASAAMLTRYPAGLASALRKISADTEPLEAANKATAHLYIVNPAQEPQGGGGGMNRLFSTHPPIEERIAALEKM
ncbi:MAG: M48 family metalloprotease [Marinilabiliales bacterium]|nr:M48 family metalloprotease [Marinilabiliales bacterium]